MEVTVVEYCSVVDDTSVVYETAVVVISATDVRRDVIVVAVDTVTVSGGVTALLQAECKLLSEYPAKGIGMAETVRLDGAMTEVGLAVVTVANSVIVDTSVSV